MVSIRSIIRKCTDLSLIHILGVDMKVKAIYDSEIGNITRSEKSWKDVLKVAGQLYRYEFDNIVMVTCLLYTSELADNLLQLGRTLGEADNFAEYYRAANVTVSADVYKRQVMKMDMMSFLGM